MVVSFWSWKVFFSAWLSIILLVWQASLGESKKEKARESVPLFVKFGDQKLVLGTLITDNIPQLSFDLVFEKEFELSHNWKNGSVYFCGYQTPLPQDSSGDWTTWTFVSLVFECSSFCWNVLFEQMSLIWRTLKKRKWSFPQFLLRMVGAVLTSCRELYIPMSWTVDYVIFFLIIFLANTFKEKLGQRLRKQRLLLPRLMLLSLQSQARMWNLRKMMTVNQMMKMILMMRCSREMILMR